MTVAVIAMQTATTALKKNKTLTHELNHGLLVVFIFIVEALKKIFDEKKNFFDQLN